MSIITSFKKLLIEALSDNKRLIIGLYALFFISFILSWIFSKDLMATAAANIMNTANTTAAGAPTSATEVFIHNAVGAIFVYISSILFGITAIGGVIYNGINLGLFGSLFATLSVEGGIRYILYLIPHGIFEFTATVIQSVAGIQLFLFIWKFIKDATGNKVNKAGNRFSESFAKNKKRLIHSIVLMIFVIILLLIAAPIESYVSLPFAEFITGLL